MASASPSLARRLRAGETVFCGWCSIPAPMVAELIAREGFSAVLLDQQHGLYDMAATAAGIAAIHHAGSAPLVRIPVGDFAVASRVLDFGAEGVIAPMINSVEDARALVAATKFPPVGERSWGPHRAIALMGLELKAYFAEANAIAVAFAMIETRTALDNARAIAGTEEIDGLFLGPSDLSIALSAGRELDPMLPEVDRELGRLVEAAKAAGKIAGAYCATPERALALAGRGFRFLAVGSDHGFLRGAAAAALQKLKR
jgi:4-hydroxy-2-oxoheptanedioate aldolase